MIHLLDKLSVGHKRNITFARRLKGSDAGNFPIFIAHNFTLDKFGDLTQAYLQGFFNHYSSFSISNWDISSAA